MSSEYGQQPAAVLKRLCKRLGVTAARRLPKTTLSEWDLTLNMNGEPLAVTVRTGEGGAFLGADKRPASVKELQAYLEMAALAAARKEAK